MSFCYFVFIGVYDTSTWERVKKYFKSKFRLPAGDVFFTAIHERLRKYLKYDRRFFIKLGQIYKIIFVHDYGRVVHPIKKLEESDVDFSTATEYDDINFIQRFQKDMNFNMQNTECKRIYTLDISREDYDAKQKRGWLSYKELDNLLEPLCIDIATQLNVDYDDRINFLNI